jgi:hypothetical protein
MSKKQHEDFNLDNVPDDDVTSLYEDEDGSSEPEEEPVKKTANSSKGKKQVDEPEEEGAQEEAEEDDDYSDLGLDDEDDDEADDKSKTSKIPDKFKGKSLEDVVESYKNAEKEIGNLRNEINNLKKGIAPKEETDDDNKPVNIMEAFPDLERMNYDLLNSENPAQVVIEMVAKAFNALLPEAEKRVTKIVDEKDKQYHEEYFNEIKESRELRKAAEPYEKAAKSIALNHRDDWVDVLPYIQKAVEKNPDLLKTDSIGNYKDSLETLYNRCKGYMESKGLLEAEEERQTTRKRTGSIAGSKNGVRGRNSGEESEDTDVISKLYEK